MIRMKSYEPEEVFKQEQTKRRVRLEIKKMLSDDVPQTKEINIDPYLPSYGRDFLMYQIYKTVNRDEAALFRVHKYGDKFFVSYKRS